MLPAALRPALTMNSVAPGAFHIYSIDRMISHMNRLRHHNRSKTGVNALVTPSKTGVNALVTPSKTGVNALVTPSKTGVNALVTPSKTGVNALVTPSKTGVNALVVAPSICLALAMAALGGR